MMNNARGEAESCSYHTAVRLLLLILLLVKGSQRYHLLLGHVFRADRSGRYQTSPQLMHRASRLINKFENAAAVATAAADKTSYPHDIINII